MSTESNMVAKAIGVTQVPTGELQPNPHNPRRLFDREDMRILEASIEQVGILVPLTVYKERSSGRFTILDGQRRWMCALKLGIRRIPVNEVQEPSLVQNIVTMFQIHKLRMDWELMPTALKVEILIKELQETGEKRLASLTGLDQAVVVRCKKLLWYPRRYQNMMLRAEKTDRIKADFFIELYPVLTDRYVKKFDWFDKNEFTDAMLIKMEKRTIKAVTDFRVVKQHINNAVKSGRIGRISTRLREFAKNADLTIDHLSIESAAVAASARKIIQAAARLYAQIEAIDPAAYYGERKLWDQLESLAGIIRKKLREADRRLKA
jgi:ParB family chromosome partitioning protein